MSRPPLPPFDHATAVQKVRMAEDAWNTRDAGKVSGAYALDSRWRNREEFITGRDEIVAFLTRTWERELEYRLIWEFDENGLMRRRHASIDDLPIGEADRLYRWPQGRRPDDHPGLTELGL